MLPEQKVRKLRILDFDIENRPLSYLGMDFTTMDITAIAAGWAGPDGNPESEISCWLLDKNGKASAKRMLRGFVQMYNAADIVTGHYILGHDLGHINGALVELGMEPLGPKLVSDTKNHLIRFTGISKSQENLSETFEMEHPKIHMNTPRWREANRLTKAGLEITRKRVVGDVEQHMELRFQLLRRGLLKTPVMYDPSGR